MRAAGDGLRVAEDQHDRRQCGYDLDERFQLLSRVKHLRAVNEWLQPLFLLQSSPKVFIINIRLIFLSPIFSPTLHHQLFLYYNGRRTVS